MAELSLSTSVGARPAPNKPDDVRTVQNLLRKVTPPLATKVGVTGQADPATLQAIREFQKRFMNHPDGQVDPDGRTLMHLNDGFASQYVGCSADKKQKIDGDLLLAQKWLDTALIRLPFPNNVDLKTKVNNIFSIDIGASAHSAHYALLVANFRKLRSSMDDRLTLVCVNVESVNACWVDETKPSNVNFAKNYFELAQGKRTAKIIHERSHIVLSTKHSGMSAGGTVTFGEAPDDKKGFTIADALDNAYCYEYLAVSLQTNYRPDFWR